MASVAKACFPISQESERTAGLREDLFYLVIVGVGYVLSSFVISNPDGMLQAYSMVRSVYVAEDE